MGGAQAGEVASQIAIEAFEDGLPDAGSPEERLASGSARPTADLRALARRPRPRGHGDDPDRRLPRRRELAIAHVGDSRAYLFRDGELTRLTQDHSLVDELVRRGKLTEEQAAEHPQRSIITRALGPEREVEVDTWTYPVRGGDVAAALQRRAHVDGPRGADRRGPGRREPRRAPERLIEEANEAGGRDNITVVLFRVEEVGSADGVDQPTTVAPARGRRPSTDARTPPRRRPPSVAPPCHRPTRGRGGRRSRRPRPLAAAAPLRRARARHQAGRRADRGPDRRCSWSAAGATSRRGSCTSWAPTGRGS